MSKEHALGITIQELITAKKVLRVLSAFEEEQFLLFRNHKHPQPVSATEVVDLASIEAEHEQACEAIKITLGLLKRLPPDDLTSQ